MHEMPIAADIVARSLEAAAQHNARRIEEVEVEVGAMRQVVPEALQLAFEVTSHGTLAEGATLRIIEEKVVAVCNDCECMFVPPDEFSFLCPQCEKANARIVAGNDIVLKSVVCDADEEVSA